MVDKVTEQERIELRKTGEGKRVIAQLNPISLILSGIATIVMFSIMAKYWGSTITYDAALARYALMLGLFALSGPLLNDILDGTPLFHWNVVQLDQRRVETWLLVFGIALGGAVLIETLLYVALEVPAADSNVSAVDQLFYDIFAGVAEENFFRAFVIGLTLKIFKENKVAAWVANVLQAWLFMTAHSAVYGAYPYLMWTQFCLGLLWGGLYIWKRDVSALEVAHMVKNFRADWGLLTVIMRGG